MIPEPFPHQVTANNKLNPLQYAALFADMGTGKTRIAIDWFIHKLNTIGSDRVVIIAPSVVGEQWVDEQLPEHCGVHYKTHAFEAKSTQKALRKLDNFIMSAKYAEGLHILCIHFETFVGNKGQDLIQQFLSTSNKAPIIIVDESSRIKNPDAISVKHIVALRHTYPNSFRMIMSGTPASKSPVDLWSQFDFLTQNYFNCGYVVFKAAHSVRIDKKFKVKGRLMTREMTLDRDTYDSIKKIIAKNTFQGRLHEAVPAMVQKRFGIAAHDFEFVRNSPKFQRFRNMDKLQEKIAPVTYAVKLDDCADIPKKIHRKIKLPLNPEQKRLIKDLIKYSATVYDGEMLTIDIKALIGLRVLQICGGNFSHLTDLEGKFATTPIKGVNYKMKYLMEDIPEIGDQQFIICAVYTPEVIEINKQISRITDIGKLHGDTPKQERTRVIREFKAGHLQGMVMNPSVGGYGLNLQMARIQYWYSRNYKTEARLQAEARGRRITTVKSPIYKDLLSDISFEDNVLEVLQEGKDINDIFVNKAINEVFKL